MEYVWCMYHVFFSLIFLGWRFYHQSRDCRWKIAFWLILSSYSVISLRMSWESHLLSMRANHNFSTGTSHACKCIYWIQLESSSVLPWIASSWHARSLIDDKTGNKTILASSICLCLPKFRAVTGTGSASNTSGLV